jgi:RHS repeat-associated protein
VGESTPGSVSRAYVYDAAGNRTSGPLSATSTYNAADELTSDAGFTYTYDAEGQRTSKIDRASGATTRYLYNGAQQLTSIQFPDGTTTSYTYDALGRRSTVSAGGTTTAYVYDGVNARLEYVSAGLAASYLGAGKVDRPLEMTRGTNSYYYLQNFQGSVTGLTDASGSVAATYSSDAFGVPTSPTPPVTNPFTYTGRDYDAKSGLYYNRARYYEPTTGSFISQDPIKSGHRYTYAGGDPVDFTDPGGAVSFPDFGLIWQNITTKYIPALQNTACALASISAGFELAVSEVLGSELHGDTYVAMGLSIATSCVLGALPKGLQVGWGAILLPVVAALIAFVVDVVQQIWCSTQGRHPSISPQHSIFIGLASLGTGWAGALLAAKTTQLRMLLEAAVAGGGAAGIGDKLNSGGACA